MKDLHSLKRPLAIRFNKKNDVHPFEDAASLEFFSDKNDASLLLFGSHSKKRPHALTFVRCFEHKVLDMLELLVVEESMRTLSQFKNLRKATVGLKPLVCFSGSAFESPTINEYTLAKSMLLDFFKGPDVDSVDVEGLQYMISFSVGEESTADPKPKIHMRVYLIKTRKSGQRLPRVEVEEMGPRIDFRMGRMKESDEDMMKAALKKPKGSEVCVAGSISNVHDANSTTAKGKEEHHDRSHRRQGRPYPRWQAGPHSATNTQDEGSQEKSWRCRRRWGCGNGRCWRCWQEAEGLGRLMILIC